MEIKFERKLVKEEYTIKEENNMKTKNIATVTRDEYDKLLKYSRQNKLDNLTHYLIENEKEMICKNAKLSNFITEENLRQICYTGFLNAIYVMKNNTWNWDDDYTQELNLFDKYKLVQDINVAEDIDYNQFAILLKQNLNYNYIKEVLDAVAQDSGYVLVSKEELYNMTFTIPELSQLIIGLTEENGIITNYNVIELKSYLSYAFYYIKTINRETN